jgi:hypothetical protein
VELGNNNQINNTTDLDPSQAYRTKNNEIFYGREAKQEAQREWEDEYQAKPRNKNQNISTDKIMETITDQEIYEAVHKVKKRGVAWDMIAHWIPKLMLQYTPQEIIGIYKKVKIANLDFTSNTEEDKWLTQVKNEENNQEKEEQQQTKDQTT